MQKEFEGRDAGQNGDGSSPKTHAHTTQQERDKIKDTKLKHQRLAKNELKSKASRDPSGGKLALLIFTIVIVKCFR